MEEEQAAILGDHESVGSWLYDDDRVHADGHAMQLLLS